MKLDTRSIPASRTIWRTAGYTLLIAGSIVSLLPFVWMLSCSFKDPAYIFSDPVQWIPKPWLWSNYAKAFEKMPFALYTLNTVEITVLSLIGLLLSCSIVAFGFARMRFPARNVLFILLLSTMMLPPQVTIIPVFRIFSSIGWYNTFLPLIVPSLFASPFFVFLLRQYLMTIPREMDEAARIDGASTWQVYKTILLPQMKPALATVSIFAFMGSWNDFLGPLIYLDSPNKRTLALGLYAFQGQYGVDWNYLMAASTVVMLPLLIIFIIGQKYFIQGVVVSGVKG